MIARLTEARPGLVNHCQSGYHPMHPKYTVEAAPVSSVLTGPSHEEQNLEPRDAPVKSLI